MALQIFDCPHIWESRRTPPHRMLKKARLLTRPTLARRDAPYPMQGRSELSLLRGGWDDPNCGQHSTRLPTGTSRRAICPGESLLIPQLPQMEQADCSSLRASSDHCFIVGALRARRTVCLLPRILLRPRVARARGSFQPPHLLFSGLLSNRCVAPIHWACTGYCTPAFGPTMPSTPRPS